MTVDPMIAKFVPSHFDRSTVFALGDPPPDVVIMTEDELTAARGQLG